MGGVEGQARGAFAGIEFVALDHGLFLRIDHHEFARVFEVLIDQARLGIGLRIFGLSSQRNCGDHFLRRGIDQHARLAVVIADVDQVRLAHRK